MFPRCPCRFIAGCTGIVSFSGGMIPYWWYKSWLSFCCQIHLRFFDSFLSVYWNRLFHLKVVQPDEHAVDGFRMVMLYPILIYFLALQYAVACLQCWFGTFVGNLKFRELTVFGFQTIFESCNDGLIDTMGRSGDGGFYCRDLTTHSYTLLPKIVYCG